VGTLQEELTKNNFRFTEKLLYEYKTHNSAIAELEAELRELDEIPNYSRSIVKFSHNESQKEDSQPEEYVIKKNESIRADYLHNRLQERERHQKAIQEARESLPDEENQFIWLFYDLEKSIRECRQIMHFEKSKLYDMRQKVVYKVARYIGLL